MSTILFLLLFLHTTKCCQDIINQEFVPQDSPSQFFFRRPRVIVYNATILCSNISAIELINYNFTEKQYEQFLQITDSYIPVLASLAFTNFPSISKLFLFEIGIEEIRIGAFGGLLTLKELYLNDNKLKEVTNRVFNPLEELKVLDLSGNDIHRIEEFAFIGTIYLEVLLLSRNKLQNVPGRIFENLESLKNVDLSANPIQKISFRDFQSEFLNLSRTGLQNFRGSNTTIKMLDLGLNHISTINLSSIYNTEIVILSKNNIKNFYCPLSIESKMMSVDFNSIENINCTFVGLSYLNLSHNKLTNLKHLSFKNTGLLKTIDFSFNKISEFDKNLFKAIYSLEELFLQNNLITQIDVSLFTDLTSLKILNLSSNLIVNFKFGTFNSFTALTILDISNNHLKSLSIDIFDFMTSLQYLYFDNNQISTLNEEILETQLPHLRLVSVSGNPWFCTDLVKLAKTFFSMSVVVKSGTNFEVENVQGIPCHETTNKNDAGIDLKLLRFFNDDFENSKFYKFFNNAADTVAEKLKTTEEIPVDYSLDFFIYSFIVQVVFLALLIFVFSIVFKQLKEIKMEPKRKTFSELDLYS